MQTNVLSVPFLSALIIVRMPTTALWSGFWWVLTKATPLLISAPIVSPSVRSNFGSGGCGRRFFYQKTLTGEANAGIMNLNFIFGNIAKLFKFR